MVARRVEAPAAWLSLVQLAAVGQRSSRLIAAAFCTLHLDAAGTSKDLSPKVVGSNSTRADP
jgi:hypothetical protein